MKPQQLYRVRLFSQECSGTYQTFYARAESKFMALSACVEQLVESGQRFSSIFSVESY
jgi:hypothetical protein